MSGYESNYTGQQIDNAVEAIHKITTGETPAPKANHTLVWEVATLGGLQQMIKLNPSSSIGISIRAAGGETGILIPTTTGNVYVPNLAYGTLTVDKSCDATMHVTSQTGDVFHFWYNGTSGAWVRGSIQASVIKLASTEKLTGTAIYATGLYCVNVRMGSGIVTHLLSITDLTATVFSASDYPATQVKYNGSNNQIELQEGSTAVESGIESIIRVALYGF